MPQTKDETIQVRVTAQEAAAIDQAADLLDIKRSELVRRALGYYLTSLADADKTKISEARNG